MKFAPLTLGPPAIDWFVLPVSVKETKMNCKSFRVFLRIRNYSSNSNQVLEKSIVEKGQILKGWFLGVGWFCRLSLPLANIILISY